MKIPKVNISEITVIRRHLEPNERNLAKMLLDVNLELPKGQKFGIVKTTDNKITLKGASIYGADIINKLKQEGFDFIANIYSPNVKNNMKLPIGKNSKGFSNII